MTFIFVGCSSAETTDSNEKKEPENQEETGIEVEKGLRNVELTLPADFFEEDELAEMEEELKEKQEADVKRNDDGSLSVKMSKKNHKELMNEMKEGFAEIVTDITEGEDFPSIEEITYNNDLTILTMIVEKQQFEDSLDGFVTLTLGVTSLLYQAFDGKNLEKEKVTIELKDNATDELFQEIIYPDVLEEIGEELE